ncbi:hypothetical protein [Ulvibacter antarcticus]|uniref:Uncharacterized protein n=1 Tax=Ulvibacter antarcticus TaxID=442714 RepID=A0A3L9ZG59_9FLAO|nr:hypothetical protein [Ulvibacter antarcticus]RMA65712.1 hypothetical protein BXY75_0124 [Ulvibacter antarcticus]
MILKSSLILSISALCLSCGTPNKKNTNVIGPKETITDTLTTSTPNILKPAAPEGAVFGNFNGDNNQLFSHIANFNSHQEKTEIGFQDKDIKKLIVPKTLGGSLSLIELEGFDRDLLLFTAKLKDPNFNKYFLFVQRDGEWKPVINGFAIHKTNLTDTLIPIKIDPNNLRNISRHYSVFNLDDSNENGYSWLLQSESVPIKNW